jgi:hypothetical protein
MMLLEFIEKPLSENRKNGSIDAAIISSLFLFSPANIYTVSFSLPE